MPVTKKESPKIDKEELIKSMHNHFKWVYFYAAWRRKTSVAKVRLYEKWKWEMLINWKKIEEYFTPIQIEEIKVPLQLTWMWSSFNITVKVIWWWKSSQAWAVRHWISMALMVFNQDLKSTLKKDLLITRDSRKKERKKPWLKRARKAPTWVKR